MLMDEKVASGKTGGIFGRLYAVTLPGGELIAVKKKKTKIFDSLLEIPEIRDEGFGKDKTQKHGKNLRILPV